MQHSADNSADDNSEADKELCSTDCERGGQGTAFDKCEGDSGRGKLGMMF